MQTNSEITQNKARQRPYRQFGYGFSADFDCENKLQAKTPDYHQMSLNTPTQSLRLRDVQIVELGSNNYLIG